MVNKVLNISLVTKRKILRKIRRLCVFYPQIIIYKINFDETRRIYFLIKKEKVLIKYMKILEKVIIKSKFNSELIYSKKYLKVKKKKKINSKGGFQCLYAPVILIDSIYGKDGNYNPKVF